MKAEGRTDPGHGRLLWLVVGCLAIAWGWFAFESTRGESLAAGRVRSASRTAGQADVRDIAAPGRARSILAPQAPELLREGVPPSAVILVVRDESGGPIPGAVVARCAEVGARTLSSRARIGSADSSGEIEVPLEDGGTASTGLLIVSARGLLPQAISCPSAPGRYAVTLLAGSTLEIDARDLDSAPLPGVRVAVSQAVFPASIWRDTPPEQREIGSDPATTIRYGETTGSGRVVFDGLAPGDYFVRAEGESHLLVDTSARKVVLNVGPGTTTHRIDLGKICVAALETNVPAEEILNWKIRSRDYSRPGFVQEALELRKRDIERRFPLSQILLAVKPRSVEMELPQFHYWTLRHGDLVHEVPFVDLDAFERPERFVAPEVARRPTGEVLLSVEGDHGVARDKLRVELKRTARSVFGFACVEGEPRVLPVGRYVIDLFDREFARALDLPREVEVADGARAEVVLEVKKGLVPVTLSVELPPLLRGQYTKLTVTGSGMDSRRSRTRGDIWTTWLPQGAYEIVGETAGCKSSVMRLEVTGLEAVSANLVMEAAP
ncbi:MAG: hypothetical protein KDE27_24785 [Planctomycetes bacterium]|nr:hypothetical protein [Planctomycetota bacterium]